MKITLSLLLFISIWMFYGCYKDSELVKEEIIITNNPPILVDADLIGRITDENNQVLMDVTVSVAGQACSAKFKVS